MAETLYLIFDERYLDDEDRSIHLDTKPTLKSAIRAGKRLGYPCVIVRAEDGGAATTEGVVDERGQWRTWRG